EAPERSAEGSVALAWAGSPLASTASVFRPVGGLARRSRRGPASVASSGRSRAAATSARASGEAATSATVVVRRGGPAGCWRVVGGMVGLAGAAADPPATQRLVDTAWRAAGLPGSPRTGTDLDIAYAAGATGPDGILLLSGTGAVGAAFAGYAMTGRCDGLGW